MASSAVRVRVACVQNSPVHSDWDASVAAVDALLANLSADSDLDVGAHTPRRYAGSPLHPVRFLQSAAG